jgi:hypothetical protein
LYSVRNDEVCGQEAHIQQEINSGVFVGEGKIEKVSVIWKVMLKWTFLEARM